MSDQLTVKSLPPHTYSIPLTKISALRRLRPSDASAVRARTNRWARGRLTVLRQYWPTKWVAAIASLLKASLCFI